jgi:hypothetical protein
MSHIPGIRYTDVFNFCSPLTFLYTNCVRLRLKRDSTCAETRFRLSTKRRSPFKSAGASVQSTTGSRGLRISGSNGSNTGYTMFLGSVKGTGYPNHSPVSPSLSLSVRHRVPSRFNWTLLSIRQVLSLHLSFSVCG